MVRFVNRLTGGVMWVHETRVEEYKAAGHRPASMPVKAKPEETPVKKPAAAKGGTRNGVRNAAGRGGKNHKDL